MGHRFLIVAFATIFLAAACDGSDRSGAPSIGGSGGPGGLPVETEDVFDPASISGDVTLAQWESSPAEETALMGAIDAFSAAYPNIKVKQTTVAGDYRAQMVKKFGASDLPDLFYVHGEDAPDWMSEGYLQSLDDYITRQGFDTGSFFPDYLSIFQQDGSTYGLPKDGDTIAMAVNTNLVPSPPTTMGELVQVATSLKGNSEVQAPMCLNPALDRGLAFIYAQGGSLLSDDGSTATIDSAESKAAVQWYLDLFRNGLGVVAPKGESCVGMLGKGRVAIVFEGGGLKAAMDGNPGVIWEFAEMPTGSSGQKVTINSTSAYGIGVDSKNKDQAWVLMQYLTGPEGMAKWTAAGIAAPSRSDVPAPAGFEAIVAGAAYARPGSGFMAGYADVEKAFRDAFQKQVTIRTYDAGPVVEATKAKIDEVLASQ